MEFPNLKPSYSVIASILTLLLIGFGCATPTQPTGGPADQTPPRITEVVPQNGTVNFEGDEIRFTFDKYVNRESFAKAFRIEPLVGIRYDLNWSGRSVRVRFAEPLPDSTTVIFTVGTEFSDTNRNRITQPFVLALSTGDTIDEGEISGKLVNAQTGKGKEEVFVFLFREPFDLEAQADYVAETDTAGNLKFSYLRSGEYKAIWVDDRNRNNRWNRANEVARPFYEEFVSVTQITPAELGTMYISEPDTVRPQLQGTGMFSSQRLRLRYSRNMMINPGASITVLDSLENRITAAVPLYVDTEQANVVFARANQRLDDENMRYSLQTSGITDISGNEPRSTSPFFSGSSQQDTTAIKLIRHITEQGVRQDEPLVFEFSTNVEGTAIIDSLQVMQDETIFDSWEAVQVENNLLYIYPAGVWDEASDYTVRLYNMLRGSYQNTPVTVFPESGMGSIRLTINNDQRKDGIEHRIRIKGRGEELVFDGSTEDELLVENMVPGTYTIISFRDDDGSGTWFRGEADPFRAAEPFVISRNIEIFTRMEGELEIRYAYTPGTGLDTDFEPSQEETIGETEPVDIESNSETPQNDDH